MGHFLPVMHIAEELVSRGHTVYVITLSYLKEQCAKVIEEVGCIPMFSEDGITREDVMPSKEYPFANP